MLKRIKLRFLFVIMVSFFINLTITNAATCDNKKLEEYSMKNGILVPMNDKTALVEAMSYVADHVDEVRRISQAAMEIREISS